MPFRFWFVTKDCFPSWILESTDVASPGNFIRCSAYCVILPIHCSGANDSKFRYSEELTPSFLTHHSSCLYWSFSFSKYKPWGGPDSRSGSALQEACQSEACDLRVNWNTCIWLPFLRFPVCFQYIKLVIDCFKRKWSKCKKKKNVKENVKHLCSSLCKVHFGV